MSSRFAPGRLGGLLVLAAGMLAGCVDQQPTGPATALRAPLNLSRSSNRPDRYVVSFKAAEPGGFEAAVKAAGGVVERRHPGINIAVVRGVGSNGAAALARSSGVETVAQDLRVQFIPAPDPALLEKRSLTASHAKAPGTDQSGAFFYDFQWNMRQVSADKAWGATPGGRGALVCVLDTGIDPDHIDLQGKVDPSLLVSFISDPLFPGDLDPLDYNFHGTASAGYISTNGLGMASVAPDASLCSAKVLDVLGSGSFADVIAGIEWAADNHADVINMSLGGTVDLTIPGARDLVKMMQKAVLRAVARGVTVVASAGNDAVDLDHDPPNEIVLPAQLLGVVSVGATGPFNQTDFDALASYSNFGGRTGVDLMAPGGDFVSGNVLDFVLSACSEYQLTLPFACGPLDYVFAAGTSESAPHVSGAAAVFASKWGRFAGPVLTSICLERGADPIGPRRIFGAGRLNVLNTAYCR